MTRGLKRIAVAPGDGIGPEVTAEAVRLLEHLRATHGVELEIVPVARRHRAQHAHRLARHLRADAVARQNRR